MSKLLFPNLPKFHLTLPNRPKNICNGGIVKVQLFEEGLIENPWVCHGRGLDKGIKYNGT